MRNLQCLIVCACATTLCAPVWAQEISADYNYKTCHTNTASAPYSLTCTHAVIDIDETEEDYVHFHLVDVKKTDYVDTTDDGPLKWWCLNKGRYILCVPFENGNCSYKTHKWKCRGAIRCYLGINAGYPTLVDDTATDGKIQGVTMFPNAY